MGKAYSEAPATSELASYSSIFFEFLVSRSVWKWFEGFHHLSRNFSRQAASMDVLHPNKERLGVSSTDMGLTSFSIVWGRAA